jgi:hypothetical protein
MDVVCNLPIKKIKLYNLNMKEGLLLIAFTLFYFTSFGQANYGFEEGIIVTKQNDTIRCHLELAVTYGNKIAYKKSATGQVQSISSKEIKSILTPYKYWENIQLGKKERLMSLIVDGNTQLFNHVIINTGPSTSGQGGNYTMNSAPTIIYALNHKGSYYEIKKNNFKEITGQKLEDCPMIIAKINSKAYKLEDLEKIVMEYNSCK